MNNETLAPPADGQEVPTWALNPGDRFKIIQEGRVHDHVFTATGLPRRREQSTAGGHYVPVTDSRGKAEEMYFLHGEMAVRVVEGGSRP